MTIARASAGGSAIETKLPRPGGGDETGSAPGSISACSFFTSAWSSATAPGAEPSLSTSARRPPRTKGGATIAPDIALQPFGGGVSMCPGRHLAFAEVKAFVALTIYRWELELLG